MWNSITNPDWLVVSTPLTNMKVSWDYYSQYMEKNVPNHQPADDSICHMRLLLLYKCSSEHFAFSKNVGFTRQFSGSTMCSDILSSSTYGKPTWDLDSV